MTRRIAAILTVASLLTDFGYAAAQQERSWREALANYELRKADCSDRRQRGDLPTETVFVHCVNDGLYGEMARAGYPDLDLIQLMMSEELAIAERFDKGTISQTELDAQVANLTTRIVGEKERRNLARASAAAQTQAAEAAEAARQLTRRLEQDAVARAIATERERRRRCFAAGIGQPTRTGRFSEALANAQAACSGFQLPQPPPAAVSPQPAYPTHTHCQVLGTIVICNSN